MIYVPNVLVFIHIPRTGGNWLKHELAQVCGEHKLNFHISTIDSIGGVHRHMRACDVRGIIGEWSTVRRVAFDRPYWDIVESDYRLHQQHLEPGNNWYDWSPDWRNEMAWFAKYKPTVKQFEEHRWRPWCDGDPWNYWCDDTVERIPFADRVEACREFKKLLVDSS